jgi:hypothetical protein
MAVSAKVRQKITANENDLRNSLWPDAEDRLWTDRFGGFIKTPKTLPYVSRILDEMSKDFPLGSTYVALWSFTWSNNAFVRLNKPDDVAYAAGFSGQRGRRTLLDRIRRLELLGFIDVQPMGNESNGFIYLPNPHALIIAHQSGSGPKLPPSPPKGLTTSIPVASYNAFLSRALELGCNDVKALLGQLAAAKAKKK